MTRILGRRRLDLFRSMKRVSKPSPVPPSAFDQAAPLSPFLIRKLAGRKGFTVDSVMKGKGGMRFVSLADGKSGELADNPGKYRGFTLAEAKRYLEQLPNRSRASSWSSGTARHRSPSSPSSAAVSTRRVDRTRC